ncbi:hypothetical protein [Gordonia sp. SCSIO 19800]|uniref:hypothetical protein n=1 Tax=Gordonia sp. SCSIO 19800 TaxID=2826926 RepID=UPI00201368DA|nr:hypothetical protein [Gordonia sp. SCSIO 19800]
MTADSEEDALQRLREKLESLLDDDERTARIISLGEQAAQGRYTGEGFEARLIDQEAYEDRMIEAMETYFDQD